MKALVYILGMMATAGVAAAQVQLLANPGFESATHTGYTTYSEGATQLGGNGTSGGWQTTAADNKIEVWRTGYEGVSTANGPGAANTFTSGGSYFAELNANQVSTLYQDITFTSTMEVDYFFLHRGRSGVDTMDLKIDYLGADGAFGGVDDVNLISRRAIADNINDVGEYNGWKAYSGDNVFTATVGQVYRFSYISVSSSVNGVLNADPTYGNFIDASAFGRDLNQLEGFSAGLTPVPESSTYALAGTALLGGLALLRHRRRRAALVAAVVPAR